MTIPPGASGPDDTGAGEAARDATWDAAEWSAQVWDGERWVDAEPPPGAAALPGAGGPAGTGPADGEEWEESWEYHEVEVEAEPNRQRQAVIAGGVVITLLLLAAAVAVALGGGSEDQATTAGTTPPSTKGTTVATKPATVQAPLTGLPADAASRTRPALIVKIDNVDRDARPQSGVNAADIVFEEKVEGPNSRFAAVFQSQGADDVGPVRSGRTTDIGIASPFNRPLFAFSGANPVFRPLINQAAIVDVGADVRESAYRRDGAKEAPYNLYTSTATLWKLAEADRPPPAMFTYRDEGQAPKGGRPVAGVRYDWGGGQNGVVFAWDAKAGVWSRFQNGTPHVDAEGVQIAPVNVVLLFVEYVDTGVTDVAGTPVPEAEFEGSGEAWVFTDGQLIQGRWTKSNVDDMVSLADADGRDIPVTRGRSWVSLVPNGAPTVANDRAGLGLPG